MSLSAAEQNETPDADAAYRGQPDGDAKPGAKDLENGCPRSHHSAHAEPFVC